MFVRVATFEGGDTQRLTQFTEERRQSGELKLPQGVNRIMVLDGDRRLLLSFADSRDSLEKAEKHFASIGDQIPEELRGSRTSVDVYEVVLDEAVSGGGAAAL